MRFEVFFLECPVVVFESELFEVDVQVGPV